MSNSWIALILSLGILTACGEEEETYAPKPKGYMRVDLPERSYTSFSDSSCPYSFEYPDSSSIRLMMDTVPCAHVIDLKAINADLYMGYEPIDTNLAQKIRQANRAVQFNEVRADAITPDFYTNPEKGVYGTFFTLTGNSATPFQFYLTDSTNHFVKGTFMFRTTPNYDSLRPYIDYAKVDLEHLLETFEWK